MFKWIGRSLGFRGASDMNQTLLSKVLAEGPTGIHSSRNKPVLGVNWILVMSDADGTVIYCRLERKSGLTEESVKAEGIGIDVFIAEFIGDILKNLTYKGKTYLPDDLEFGQIQALREFLRRIRGYALKKKPQSA